jgi:hypothetical protein
MIEGRKMKEFLQYTKELLAEDFRAQFAPILAIRNFIVHYAYRTPTQ